MKERQWYKKYRPQNLDTYVFPNKKMREIVYKWIEQKDIPDVLFSGVQGTGKTTLARIIVNILQIKKYDLKVINGSTSTGIDTVRNTVESFVKTLPMGDKKIMIIEEADQLSHSAQKGLLAIIEDSEEYVRFIFTCNYPEKLIPALHSRLQHLHFDELHSEHVVETVATILESENIDVDDVDLVYEHIDTYYPDLRKIINSIQESSMTGKLQGVIVHTKDAVELEDWYNACLNPNKETMLNVAMRMNITSPDVVYETLYANVCNLPEALQDQALVALSEHIYRSSFVANQNLCLAACVVKIFEDI